METQEQELRSAFYKKKSNFRAAALALDWSKDGLMALPGGRSYNFLSGDKVKKNLAPLFPKFGLELEVDCKAVTQVEAIGNMTQHWLVECEYTLVDVDTGFSTKRTSFGEAADSGDKGVGKARSHAFKRWAVEEFSIADGIDADNSSVESGGRFKPMTDEEEAKVISKVQEKAIARAVPKATLAKMPEAPAKEEPKAEVEEAPKAVAPAKPKTKAEEAIEALKAEKEAQLKAVKAENEAKVKAYKLTGPPKMAVDKIVNALTAKAEAGELDEETFSKMKADRDSIDSGKKANEFIMKYQAMCA